jgi:hypothetical protein
MAKLAWIEDLRRVWRFTDADELDASFDVLRSVCDTKLREKFSSLLRYASDTNHSARQRCD